MDQEMMSVMFGFFLGGCFWGLIPLVVGIKKKRGIIGLVLMAVCGSSAIYSATIPFWLAVISGIILFFVPKKKI